MLTPRIERLTMSSNRQKSFTATLGTHDTLLHFLNLLHAPRALVTYSFGSGGFFTGKRQQRDDSHFLGLRPEVPVNAKPRLLLYFRYTGSDYRLYIRTSGPYFGQCLSISDTGLIGAYPAAGSTTFNLVDRRHNILTLDNIKQDYPEIYIQAKGSGLLHKHKLHDSKYIYIGDRGGAPMLFNLIIQERNAPHLNSLDED
jgi:hypothetical protein